MKKITQTLLMVFLFVALFSTANGQIVNSIYPFDTVEGRLFKDVGTGDWSLGGNGENLEIREPEQGNQIWARFVDDQRLELTGTPNLHISGYIRGSSPLGVLRISTPSNGYIDVGPRNAGWSHFITDRPKYYFDKEIRVNSGYIGSYDENLSLRTSGTTRITVLNSNGNVGIGTSSPAYKLHVSDRIKLGGGSAGMWVESGNTDWFIGRSASSVNSGTNLRFYNNGADRLTIKTNGNVGIGCNNPQAKLAVNGRIKATALVVTTAPCSDFVFEPDYNLMDLSTLEEYVTSNKHLPEVPSAQEFSENGYSVGEMDDILLRKVEELTLYIIKQQKEIEELKSKLK